MLKTSFFCYPRVKLDKIMLILLWGKKRCMVLTITLSLFV
jgi:hypothetical protein